MIRQQRSVATDLTRTGSADVVLWVGFDEPLQSRQRPHILLTKREEYERLRNLQQTGDVDPEIELAIDERTVLD
jgi:hypothetical protein